VGGVGYLAPMPERRPEECPYARPFPPDFGACPAFRPDEYVALDMRYQALRPVWTCANFQARPDADQRGRYYGNCRLGDESARRRWADQAVPAQVEGLRRLRREMYSLAAGYRDEIWEAKGAQLKAFSVGADAGPHTRRLRDLAERNLTDVRGYVEANQALLDEIGMPKSALLQLISYQLERFVSQPSSEAPGAPPARVMERFPVTVRRLIMPEEAN